VRGDYFHNEILPRPLDQVGKECAATVYVEHPVRIGGTTCYADRVFEKGGRRIVVEVKQLCRGTDNDVRKAVALNAQLLLMVTPDALTAQACRRQLRRHPPGDAKLKVIACPLGAAVEILRQALTAPHSPAAPVAHSPRTES
jgi:hypothetical protein